MNSGKTRYDMFRNAPAPLMARMIIEMANQYQTAEKVEEVFNMPLTEKELQQFNEAARKDGLISMILV